ncbi:hypothetical protein EWM64_g1269 [Hericium alpestre]|uniref:Cyanase n=1 Tax=Hericium alpestre TaxID=135208 RepID=A0A4Z0A9X7_9AGAM|nr:hypothetical protein EWM64_g1269 [Hericium alpestre]
MATSATSSLPPIYDQLLKAKARKGLTFEQIAKAMGKDEVWVAALMYGQAKGSPQDLSALAQLLEVEETALTTEIGEAWWPDRGLGSMPPRDPVIYRLVEGVMVYGYPLKFGDGIMSMIDCKVTVDKKEDPKGDRVILSFE